MPSLVDMYSYPEDIGAFLRQAVFYREMIGHVQFVPPLMEHGPEQDDRWCLKHYQECGWFRLALFRNRCRDCEDEAYQEWIQDVRRRLEFGLAAAAHGMTVTWRPAEDTPELIVARMMELANAPATLTESLAWVHKYLTGVPGEADPADA